jgi:hypothetical protein
MVIIVRFLRGLAPKSRYEKSRQTFGRRQCHTEYISLGIGPNSHGQESVPKKKAVHACGIASRVILPGMLSGHAAVHPFQ